MRKSSLLIATTLFTLSLCSCGNNDPVILKDDTAKNALQREVLSDPFPTDPVINPAGLDLIDSFILAYDRNTIKEFMDGTSSLKGLYIDEKLISIIRDPKYTDLKGLYLYFGKRIKDRKLPINASDRFHDGKYTLIAIPSLPSINNPGKDSLIVSESLEWHDPISSHKPTNEQEIGY